MPRNAETRKVWNLENKERINQNQRDWRARYPDKVKDIQRAGKLKRKYGIDEDGYNILYNKQDGCCAICYRNETHFKGKLHIDHCHITKKVRGLLCSNCNTALGLFKDNKCLMINAINYIDDYFKRLNASFKGVPL